MIVMHREPHFHQFALAELFPFFERFPTQFLEGKSGVPIAYRHLCQQEETRGLMILVNGRAENMLKWTELAYDFFSQGYDVLQFDHRGQGYSGRFTQSGEKGHIDEFRFYVEDMAQVIAKANETTKYAQQFLLAHSLGALISAYYLANFDHRVQKAAFSSPFWGMPLKNPLRDELVISLMMLCGQGARYVFGKGAYKPAPLNENALSHCKTRMKWWNRINRKYPEMQLGGPTFRWVHLCLQAIKRLPNILPRIEIPVLLLQAEKEAIVNNQKLASLCEKLPQGQLELIKGAKHEILFEQDALRAQVLQRLANFFKA